MNKPKVNSDGQKELDKAEAQFNAFDEQVKSLTLDKLNEKPAEECEPQTKMSSREAEKTDAPYIKPLRSINSKEPFNEKYRKQWERGWEYIKCTVENYEIIGEAVHCWSKKFAGDPSHEWKVPVNKPVYIPRLLAEQLANCKYHRLSMNEAQVTQSDGMGSYVGAMVQNETRHRINCRPVGFGL